jgi:hypothetical protein
MHAPRAARRAREGDVGLLLELQSGIGILQAAGIDVAKAHKKAKGNNTSPSAPEQAYAALVGWLERGQQQRRLGNCDVHTLASTLLGALHGWAFTARVCGLPSARPRTRPLRRSRCRTDLAVSTSVSQRAVSIHHFVSVLMDSSGLQATRPVA